MTLAYNMDDKKIGCVLLQAAMGTTLSGSEVSRYFNPEGWELSPTKLKVYTIDTQEEFDLVVAITNRNHPKTAPPVYEKKDT